jgi:hypothetical protein
MVRLPGLTNGVNMRINRNSTEKSYIYDIPLPKEVKRACKKDFVLCIKNKKKKPLTAKGGKKSP